MSSIPNSTNTSHARPKRQLLAGAAIISGVLGTFLGLFNSYEIANLKQQLASEQHQQTLLIDITRRHEQHLQHLDRSLDHLTTLIKEYITFNPTLIYAKMQDQIDTIYTRVNSLFDTLQQLQHQRLAVTLLPADQLYQLHNIVLNTATLRGYKLLPVHPQDYFQLDTSYLRVQNDVVILLHVPCITSNSLLSIYRYANLPYPIDLLPSALQQLLPHSDPINTIQDLVHQAQILQTPGQHNPEALYFVPDADLIAIGRTQHSTHRYRLLTSADLHACTQRSHVYLCEQHQVLRTDLEGSCLGSLYLQSVKGVRENCKLDRKRLRETVYQLSATTHYIVTPEPFTTQIQCKNGSHFPLRINRASKIYVPPTCTVNLKNHTITSDENIRITPEPLQFTWDFNPLTLPSELLQTASHLDDQLNNMKQRLQQLHNDTIQDAEFESLLNSTVTSPSSYISILIWISVLIAGLTFCCVFVWYCCNKRRYARMKREVEDEVNQRRIFRNYINLDYFRKKRPTATNLAQNQYELNPLPTVRPNTQNTVPTTSNSANQPPVYAPPSTSTQYTYTSDMYDLDEISRLAAAKV